MAKRPIYDADLRPCPFCGTKLVGEEGIWRNERVGITKKEIVYVHPKTNCVLDYHRYHFYAHPEKVDAWNRRENNGEL